MEIFKEDMDDTMGNIKISHVNKNKKIVGGKKIPFDVPLAHMDKVSFHSKEFVLKWKYVYHIRVAPKRELSEETLKFKEIIELLQDSLVMKFVIGLSPFYP